MKNSLSTCLAPCLILLALGRPATAHELSPAEPTDCDPVVLSGSRNFTEDCNWKILSRIEFIDTETIEVWLDPRGDELCTDFPVDVNYGVELGLLPAGTYDVIVLDAREIEEPVGLELTVSEAGCTPRPGFLRGDANGDGKVDIADPITSLAHGFLGDPVTCREALDADGSGAIEITDAILLLSHLFLGTEAPPAPYPECGSPEGGLRLDCQIPQCRIDDGPSRIWLVQPDGCVQCVPCDTPPLEVMVQDLEERGFTVYLSSIGAMPVCAACEVCPSGIIYQIQVDVDDVEELRAEGWVPGDPIL